MSVPVKSDVTIASGTRSVALSTNPADRSILIVEDNRFVARQCRSALLAAGFRLIGIVTTADDAIQVALERRPRLILMDIYLLGERDGVDAAIEIFQRCGIRSIFASAPADAAGKARAEAAQPLAWLPKPFSDNRLVATVAAAIVAVNANLQLPIPAWSAPKSGTMDESSEAHASGDLGPEFHDIIPQMVA
jgi:two-component system, response regulator PdtaR